MWRTITQLLHVFKPKTVADAARWLCAAIWTTPHQAPVVLGAFIGASPADSFGLSIRHLREEDPKENGEEQHFVFVHHVLLAKKSL